MIGDDPRAEILDSPRKGRLVEERSMRDEAIRKRLVEGMEVRMQT